jgi:hypothetical protein
MRSLLQSATRRLELPDVRLVQQVEQILTSQVRRRSKVTLAWRAAAAVCAGLVLTVLLVTFTRLRPKEEQRDVNSASPPWSMTLAAPANVKLSDDVIGVPIDIGEPDVTVVWIYPTSEQPSSSN